MIIFLFILSFICERLFNFAGSYESAVIVHGVGLHIIIIATAFFLLCQVPKRQAKKRFLVKCFAYYRVLALCFYTVCQVGTGKEDWQLNKAAASRMFIDLKPVQDVFVIVVLSIIIYLLYVKF